MDESKELDLYRIECGSNPTKAEINEQVRTMLDQRLEFLIHCLIEDKGTDKETVTIKKRFKSLIKYMLFTIGIMVLGALCLILQFRSSFINVVCGATLIALLMLSYVCKVVLKRYARHILLHRENGA